MKRGHDDNSNSSNDTNVNSHCIPSQPPKMDTQSILDQPSNTVTITSLNHTIRGKWTLIGKLISRSEIREWKNMKGSGQLLEVYIVDENGDTIKAVLFNESITKYDKFLKPGSTYSFTGLRVKACNPQFSHDKYELTFDDQTTISDVSYDLIHHEINMKIVKLNSLITYEPNMTITTLGIMIDIEASKQIITSRSVSTVKREIMIADDTMSKICCTLWGNRARENITNYLGKPVLIKDAEINDYNNFRSLNTRFSSLVLFDPSLPNALELENWYQENKNKYLTFSYVETMKQSILDST